MGLETATYVDDLAITNPLAGDPRQQGDDHLRLIKTVVKNTFPNASKAFRLPTTDTLQTGNVTVVFPDDQNKIIPVSASAAARTVSLPTPSGVNADGWSVTIVKADNSSNIVTVASNGSDAINGSTDDIYIIQRWQKAVFTWINSLSAWFCQVDEATPIGTLSATLRSSAPAGWVLASGRTIGSASSSATERANADCQGLYEVLWNAYDNTICPVTGGRGASASADFSANKPLQLPDLRGRAIFGRDDMGGTTASRITNAGSGIVGTTLGASGGAQTHTLTEAELPAHSHTITDPGHDHAAPSGRQFTTSGLSGRTYSPTASGATYGLKEDATDTASATTGITLADTGSDDAHNNMPPAWIANYLIKL